MILKDSILLYIMFGFIFILLAEKLDRLRGSKNIEIKEVIIVVPITLILWPFIIPFWIKEDVMPYYKEIKLKREKFKPITIKQFPED